MKTRICVVSAVLLFAVSLIFIERSIVAVSAQDSDFNRKVSQLGRDGETPAILGQRDALRPFSTPQIESLLYQSNRYLQALAIQELRHRGDLGSQEHIRRTWQGMSLEPEDIRFDPHGPVSPDAAVFVASAEYLAASDKQDFIPKLLSRREVWAAPHLFVATFRELGEGWVRPAVAVVQDERRRAALGYLLSVATTASNREELRQVLESDHSPTWEGAARACEDVDDEVCWEALSASLADRDEAQQLLGRMIQFRKGRATAEQLFSAAEKAARRTAPDESPGVRIKYLRKLIEFMGLSHWKRLSLPPSLITALGQTGSETIVNALAAANGVEHGR